MIIKKLTRDESLVRLCMYRNNGLNSVPNLI